MSDALTAGWPAGTLSHRLEPWLETEMTKKRKKNLHYVSFPTFMYSVIKNYAGEKMKPVFMTHCDISSGVPAEPAESWLHQDA